MCVLAKLQVYTCVHLCVCVCLCSRCRYIRHVTNHFKLCTFMFPLLLLALLSLCSLLQQGGIETGLQIDVEKFKDLPGGGGEEERGGGEWYLKFILYTSSCLCFELEHFFISVELSSFLPLLFCDCYLARRVCLSM